MLLNFLVQMATRKYGKVRIGQLIGSLLGARFRCWVFHPTVTGFERGHQVERDTGYDE